MLKIAFSGRQCAGKTTAAGLVEKILNYMLDGDEVDRSEVEYVKFADTLYQAQKIFSDKKDRLFLQRLGDLVRERFGEEFFTEHTRNKIRELKHKKPLAIVIDDLRFESEYIMLRQENFLIVYVDADLEKRKERAGKLGIEINENHRSEIYLEKIREYSDLVLDNNRSIKEFEDTLRDSLYYIARHRDFEWCWE